MPPSQSTVHWPSYAIVSAVGLTLLTLVAALTRVWVLTALPVGFLSGFFLQKGALCGAAALSEVVAFRDRDKVAGLWIAIVISMVGFAVIEAAGWVQLAPKPMIWVNALVGGDWPQLPAGRHTRCAANVPGPHRIQSHTRVARTGRYDAQAGYPAAGLAAGVTCRTGDNVVARGCGAVPSAWILGVGEDERRRQTPAASA